MGIPVRRFRMKIKLVTPFALVGGFLMVCGPIFAHHGTSVAYRMDKHIVVQGTVTEFVWANPHSQIYFDVKDDQGNVVHWGAETNSPRALARRFGITKTTIKPGDEITLTLNPSKAGTPFGQLVSITLANDRTITLLTPREEAQRGQIGREAERQ